MWASFFSAIAAIPKLFEYIEKFVAWITEQVNLAKKKQDQKKLDEAIEKAKNEKDTSDLDAVFNPNKKKP